MTTLALSGCENFNLNTERNIKTVVEVKVIAKNEQSGEEVELLSKHYSIVTFYVCFLPLYAIFKTAFTVVKFTFVVLQKFGRKDIQMTDKELEEYFRSGKDYLSTLSLEERKTLFEPSDLLP